MAHATIEKLKRLACAAKEAFDDAWVAHRGEHELTRIQRFLHFWVLVGRSFVRNRCPIRASSLAYASLLALVPMLAVVIGVSSSLLKRQGEEPIEKFVTKLVASVTPDAEGPSFLGGLHTNNFIGPPAPAPAGTADASTNTAADVAVREDARAQLASDTRERIKDYIMDFVGNIRSGALSVTGVIALLVVAITMLARIEDTFNDIWGVTQGRNWFMRIILYWGALTLGPLLWAATAALTSGPYLEFVRSFIARLGPLGVFGMNLGLSLLPYVILSLAFALFYELMPNTRVQVRAALVGGVVAGFLWQLNQEFSVFYVSRVVSNSQIYGSLGAVPVFMIGLYICWIILLFGAQVAYAYENRRAYLQERQVETVNQRSRELVALRLLTEIGRRFQRNEPPPTLPRLADQIGVPTRLVNQILQVLAKAGLIAETAGPESAFVPARPLEQISIADAVHALRVGAGRDVATRAGETRQTLLGVLERIGEAERSVASGLTLRELVSSADSPQLTAPAPP